MAGFWFYDDIKIFNMRSKMNSWILLILMIGSIFFLAGCYETHYYSTYHHHSRGWYDHRHRSYPAGVNFEVDVYSRHHRR